MLAGSAGHRSASLPGRARGTSPAARAGAAGPVLRPPGSNVEEDNMVNGVILDSTYIIVNNDNYHKYFDRYGHLTFKFEENKTKIIFLTFLTNKNLIFQDKINVISNKMNNLLINVTITFEADASGSLIRDFNFINHDKETIILNGVNDVGAGLRLGGLHPPDAVQPGHVDLPDGGHRRRRLRLGLLRRALPRLRGRDVRGPAQDGLLPALVDPDHRQLVHLPISKLNVLDCVIASL